MKFLVNNFFNLLIFFSSILSNECFINWNASLVNQGINKIIHLEGIRTINDNSSILPLNFYFFIDKDIIRFDYYIDSDYSSKIIYIFDYEKSIKIHENTNQLFITNPDTNLVSTVSKFFNSNFLFKEIDNSDQKYNIRLENLFLDIDLKIKDCLILEEIDIYNFNDTLSSKNTINISKIFIEYLDINNFNEIFTNNGNYFEYDLRK